MAGLELFMQVSASGHMAPAIESRLYFTGDIDRLAGLMGFAAVVQAESDTMFSQLLATSQGKYGSAETVVAKLVAGTFPNDA
jgi:hypothetical protein